MRDGLALLIELNAALALAVILVAGLRIPVRRRLGSHAAYALWWAVPTAMVAVCLPRAGSAMTTRDIPAAFVFGEPLVAGLLLAWGCGVVVSMVAMGLAQARFETLVRRGTAGPAVTGVIVGRVVMPADSAGRWTPDELAIIRAHERAHLDRGDLRVNAVVALARCLFWFNPLAHIGASLFRFDQELACDATVMTARPGRRRLYAEALLKAASAPSAALACGWATDKASALEARLAALRLNGLSTGHAAALATLAAMVMAGGLAWGLQPPTPGPFETRADSILNLRLQPPSVP